MYSRINEASNKATKNVTTDYVVTTDIETRVEQQPDFIKQSKLYMKSSSEDSKESAKVKEISNSSSDRNKFSSSKGKYSINNLL